MNRSPFARRSLVAGGLATALLLTACGSDDEPVADPATTEAPADPDTTVPGAPDATVPDDLPEEYEGAVGPVEIIGDGLPYLETDVIEDDPALGQPAPVIVGLDFEGNPVRIDAAENGPTMVVAVAHWCPHCNDEIPVLNELRYENAFPAELEIVGVSTAPRSDGSNFPPDEWLVEKDWQWPVIADGVDTEAGTFLAAEALGVSGFPFVVLIDEDGNVAARWSGGREGSEFLGAIETYLGLS